MADNLKERIAEMKAAAEKATAGEWAASGNGVHVGIHCVATTHGHEREQRFADAAYISLVQPSTILALIAEIERQAAEIADYEQTDLVPRTRWEATNADWLEAREQFKTLAEKATVEIENLQAEIERLKRGNRIDE